MSLVIFCLLFSFVDYVPVKGEITCFFFKKDCFGYSISHDMSSNLRMMFSISLKNAIGIIKYYIESIGHLDSMDSLTTLSLPI